MAFACFFHFFTEMTVKLISRSEVGIYLFLQGAVVIVKNTLVLIHSGIVNDDADWSECFFGAFCKSKQLLFIAYIGNSGKYFYSRVDTEQLIFKCIKVVVIA